jgi:hypothetical protein
MAALEARRASSRSPMVLHPQQGHIPQKDKDLARAFRKGNGALQCLGVSPSWGFLDHPMQPGARKERGSHPHGHGPRPRSCSCNLRQPRSRSPSRASPSQYRGAVLGKVDFMRVPLPASRITE